MKVIDLFCGAGGFSEGFRQAGFEIILGVDNWQPAIETFQYNFPEAEVWNVDIMDPSFGADSIPKADVIIGGPPCPEFSIANVQNLKIQKDRKRFLRIHKRPDKSMMRKFVKIAKESGCKYWIAENVPPTKKLFPQWRCKILYAPDYGVPQNRRRAFFGNYPLPKKNRERPKFISPTIVASQYKGGPSDVRRRLWSFLGRKPTIEDCMYFQGFPFTFRFFGNKADKFTLIGNAVPPPMARALAEAILEAER